MIKTNFILPEQAMDLKELGYNYPSMALYVLGELYYKDYKLYLEQPKSINQCLAPLRQEATSWFRTNFNVDINIYRVIINESIFWSNQIDNQIYNTYEEAEDAVISHLINAVKISRDKS